MTIYDNIAPSVCAAELDLVVKAIRRHTGLRSVPMLIVEGQTDVALLSRHCRSDRKQVFPAGTRNLVEGMLIYARQQPVENCDCIYLTDCDARGKAPALSSERSLVVTECCDIEADLIHIGVVERVLERMVPPRCTIGPLIGDAIAAALPLSLVRRRAHLVGQSMHFSGGNRLRFFNFPQQVLPRWSTSAPEERVVMSEVARALDWGPETLRMVAGASLEQPPTFECYGSGKDALDALWFILCHRGVMSGVTADQLHDKVRQGLSPKDLHSWEVGRRILHWQTEHSVSLI